MVLEIRKDLTIEYADRDKWKLSGDNFADFHSFGPQAWRVFRCMHLVSRIYASAKFENNVVFTISRRYQDSVTFEISKSPLRYDNSSANRKLSRFSANVSMAVRVSVIGVFVYQMQN